MGIKEQNAEMVSAFTGFVKESKPDFNEKGILLIGEQPFVQAQQHAGVTDEELKKVRQFSSNYVAAAHEVAGMMAVDRMAADKTIDRVDVRIDMGAFGKAESNINRVHTGKIPGQPDAPEVTSYGTNNVKVTFIGGTAASGINAARDAIKEYAASKLK